ncbi:MAG: glycosyltransferase family 2 protein [Chitinispirillaceae bacterium]|nr:glycosyltransferase family 2 protein [Chitinispirillaceae bacterium]
MYKNRKIGVIVPAHNESRFIANVINTMPRYVDKIFVVNDASTDNTAQIIRGISKKNNKVVFINRRTRGGVGGAILTGHKKAMEERMDVLGVMAGDGQMDPDILSKMLDPVVDGVADYTKGNRISNSTNRKDMPPWRLFGNFLLTFLTKIASGYWNITDPQDGFTAISVSKLKMLNMSKIENGFAFENDMLIKLNAIGARIQDVSHPAIYQEQKSKIKYVNFIFDTSWVLFKGFFWRIWTKYIVKKTGWLSNKSYLTQREKDTAQSVPKVVNK